MNRLYRGKPSAVYIQNPNYIYGFLVKESNGSNPPYIAIIPVTPDGVLKRSPRHHAIEPIPVHPETVGQSTGEFDINGKEVYAGHMVELYYDGELQHSGKVVFEHGAFCVKNADGESFCLCLAHSDRLTIKIVAEE